VWANNALMKTKFLTISSSITIIVHSVSIACVFLIAHFVPWLLPIENPPITHCFRHNSFPASLKYPLYANFTQNFIAIKLCSKRSYCPPLIRICSENENPSDFLLFYGLPFGFGLLLLSFCATLCLQKLSCYTCHVQSLKTILYKLSENLSKLSERSCI
jgi:hypothetical protein